MPRCLPGSSRLCPFHKRPLSCPDMRQACLDLSGAHPPCREAILEGLLGLLPTADKALGKVSRGSLEALHSMLSWHGSPGLRHLAFVALMRLGRQAPTLFRKDEDPAHDATEGMPPDTAFV